MPSLLKVGDEIGFYLVPTKTSKPVEKSTEGNGKSPPPANETQPEFEYVGPFRVLSIGTKLGLDVTPSGAGSTGAERELTLAVKQYGDSKKLDPMASKLLEARLAGQGGRSGIAGIVLHSAKHLNLPAKKQTNE